MLKTKPYHILNTAASLLGFCLLSLISIRIFHFSTSTTIDDVAAVVSCLLMVSCTLSFFSIRHKNIEKAGKLENAAGVFFILAILYLAAGVLLISF